ILTAVPARHLDETERIVRAALQRLADERPAREELDRAVRVILTEHARAAQSAAERVRTIAFWETRGRAVPSAAERADALRAVTPEEVAALVKDLLDGSPLGMVTLR